MFLRLPLALLASALCIGSAQADRLLVAGSDGFVFQADTDVGNFQYFACQCGGPIGALAADDESLYAGDAFGNLLVFDVDDGTLMNIHPLGFGPLDSLAAADGDVFAGTESGLVLRIEPDNGVVLEARALPAAVTALVEHRGMLFAASGGGIYSAPVAGADFTYFTCFCFFDIKSFDVIESRLVVADGGGAFVHVDLATGQMLNAFWVGTLNSMVAQAGDLLIHLGGGAITRFSLEDGLEMPGGYTSPIAIDAMLVIRGEAQTLPFRAVHSPK